MQERNDSQAFNCLQGQPIQQFTTLKSLPYQKTKVYTKLQPNRKFNCLCVHQNTLYLGTKNSQVFIYSIRLNEKILNENDDDFILKEIKMITPHCKIVSSIKANSNYFVTVPQTDQESFISVWSARTQTFIIAFEGHKSQVSQIVFMENDKYFITASWDSTAKIWGLDQLQKLKPYRTFKGNYPILAVKQFNEQILILGGDDCYLVFWNWHKSETIRKQFGHAGSVMHINVLNDYVFTSGGDNKFKFWQVIHNEVTQKSIQSPAIDFRQKYQIKKIAQHLQQYDPDVFGVHYDDYLLVIDKRGEAFLFNEETEIFKLGNYFDDNQQISGVDVYGDFILVTTSKGILKHINFRYELNRVTASQKSSKVLPSNTQILNVESNNIISEKSSRHQSDRIKKEKEQKK